MEAKNVRIGNIVSHRNRPRKIYQSHFHGCFIDYCKGLNITEEWLLKLGFEKSIHDGMYFHKKMERVYVHIVSPINIHFGNKSGGIKIIDYVHQLQNLFFAITETELELNTKL